ncbi:hypothetical protein AG1IA_06601 [Rhizoctonia solani AG-1 IA]|uniref:Uncharacterized protein n=1 Tax=Thanatephorus cucumeris (strain AG1-IA) TaxID=983506 RepID=L8WRK2_THACA|nr:hypothetical protein AG1IA_06601 [Rhizoctonia solani AG-1 IA]
MQDAHIIGAHSILARLLDYSLYPEAPALRHPQVQPRQSFCQSPIQRISFLIHLHRLRPALLLETLDKGAIGLGALPSPLLCLLLFGGARIAILTVPTTGLPLPKLLARLGGGTEGYVRFDLWVASSFSAPFKLRTPFKGCWGGGGAEEGVVRVVNCDPVLGKNGCVGERE